jgi:hypothetical protein
MRDRSPTDYEPGHSYPRDRPPSPHTIGRTKNLMPDARDQVPVRPGEQGRRIVYVKCDPPISATDVRVRVELSDPIHEGQAGPRTLSIERSEATFTAETPPPLCVQLQGCR